MKNLSPARKMALIDNLDDELICEMVLFRRNGTKHGCMYTPPKHKNSCYTYLKPFTGVNESEPCDIIMS